MFVHLVLLNLFNYFLLFPFNIFSPINIRTVFISNFIGINSYKKNALESMVMSIIALLLTAHEKNHWHIILVSTTKNE